MPVGEAGEIRVRGPQLMAGYRNNPSETAEALRDGWLYTGDIGAIDADGYLAIRDRKKDLVIVSGYNVYPREVEEVLYRHPAIAEVAVIGEPDARKGERLCALIVARGRDTPHAGELVDFCAQHLVRYKIPSEFRLVRGLPKTAVGKIDRKASEITPGQFDLKSAKPPAAMSTAGGNRIFTGLAFMYTVHTIRDAILEHDPEKWETVSRLREARFGGRSKVGKIMLQQNL